LAHLSSPAERSADTTTEENHASISLLWHDSTKHTIYAFDVGTKGQGLRAVSRTAFTAGCQNLLMLQRKITSSLKLHTVTNLKAMNYF